MKKSYEHVLENRITISNNHKLKFRKPVKFGQASLCKKCNILKRTLSPSI